MELCRYSIWTLRRGNSPLILYSPHCSNVMFPFVFHQYASSMCYIYWEHIIHPLARSGPHQGRVRYPISAVFCLFLSSALLCCGEFVPVMLVCVSAQCTYHSHTHRARCVFYVIGWFWASGDSLCLQPSIKLSGFTSPCCLLSPPILSSFLLLLFSLPLSFSLPLFFYSLYFLLFVLCLSFLFPLSSICPLHPLPSVQICSVHQ